MKHELLLVSCLSLFLTQACSPSVNAPQGSAVRAQEAPSPVGEEASIQRETSVDDRFYTAKNSQEALLVFDHEVEMENFRKPGIRQAHDAIEAQLLHLFGPMAVAEYPAVPRGEHKVTRVEISPKSEERGIFSIRYHYEGTIVVRKGLHSKYTVVAPQ